MSRTKANLPVEFLAQVYRAMILVGACDGDFCVIEKQYISNFYTNCELDGHAEPLEEIDLKSFTKNWKEKLVLITKKCDSDRKKFFLLDHINRIADADSVLDENEVEAVKLIKTEFKIGIALTKQISEWTTEQSRIINADSKKRLLIDAPPGAGKTAVVVARVKKLIEEDDVEPSNIWLISFTRAAVREMKDRLALIESEVPPYVRVATLDSSLFVMNYSLNPNATDFSNGYEANIESFEELITSKDSDLIDTLENMEHVIIDEAQDLIGVRARVCLEIIELLPRHCGFTVLGDPQQQIYGEWAAKNYDGTNLHGMIEKDPSLGFERIELSQIHRTKDPILLSLVEDLRTDLVVFDDAGMSDYQRRQDMINETINPLEEEIADVASEAHLILYRSKKAVMTACSNLFFKGRNFKIRSPEYPRYLAPWVNEIFKYSDEKKIDVLGEEEIKVISGNLSLRNQRYLKEERLFENLSQIANDKGDISVNRLRERLAKGNPPVEFQHPEFGYTGPTIGTIHPSKGREADHVFLDLPRGWNSQDHNEESRVLFVGVSRARESLHTIENDSSGWCNMKYPKPARLVKIIGKSGRDKIFLAELGLKGDFDPYSCVAIKGMGMKKAEATQKFLEKFRPGVDNMHVNCYASRVVDGKLTPEYYLYAKEGESKYHLGKLESQFYDSCQNSLSFLTRSNSIEPPLIFSFRIFDIATHVCKRDDPREKKILKPFFETGSWLYPVIFSNGPFEGKYR